MIHRSFVECDRTNAILHSFPTRRSSDLGAITLMTLHAAKGLEFTGVAMIGLEEGLLPHARVREHPDELEEERRVLPQDRKSTRLNSSHVRISYAVFCLKKKNSST